MYVRMLCMYVRFDFPLLCFFLFFFLRFLLFPTVTILLYLRSTYMLIVLYVCVREISTHTYVMADARKIRCNNVTGLSLAVSRLPCLLLINSAETQTVVIFKLSNGRESKK
jgi:hypothetical protein